MTVPNSSTCCWNWPGFRVLGVNEDGGELLIGIKTIRRVAGCVGALPFRGLLVSRDCARNQARECWSSSRRP